MYILGIHNDEDSGIALIKNGQLIEAISEERFTRIKQFKGFPKFSINYILNKYNIKLEDIDYFAYGWNSKNNDCYHYATKLAKRIIYALKNDCTCSDIIEQRLEVENEREKVLF